MVAENCAEFKSCAEFMKSQICPHNESVPVVTIVLLVLSVILFILLILRDWVTGLKIRAHWIPGDFLVLSALTIQLLNLISTQGQPLNWQQRDILLVEFWMIHSSRIMLCIVIAYFIPAMANPGAEDFWGKITSLALTVFLHVISELYIIKPSSANDILKSLWPKQQRTSITLYYILAALMFTSFVLLLLQLACSNIAGRGIERIVAKKIPLIVKVQVEEDHHHHNRHPYEVEQRNDDYPFRCQECWQRVEDAVLQAWIVARAYSLDYVIARSPLASSAAIIVTIQIAITIIVGVLNSPKLLICTPLDKLRFSITMMQCVFILIGWSMILWRWVTAVAYYGNWRSCFRIEDFWTRHLRELQEVEKTQPQQAQLLHAKVEKLVVNQSTTITLHKYILYAVIGVQLLTVSFSKACLLASQTLFRNPLTGKLLSILLKKTKKGYTQYYRGLLEGVKMIEESPESLWLSNHESIPIAVKLISRGKTNGERNCEHLVDFLATKRTRHGLGLSCLDPSRPHTELKNLCKKSQSEENRQPQEGPQEGQFTDMSSKSWKMTAVALLSIIVQLSPICAETEKENPSTSRSFPPKVVKDCLDAYSQAWEIVDFVDRADLRADEITSEAADKYFGTVRKKVVLRVGNSGEATPPRNVTEALDNLKEKTQGFPNRWTGGDSTDWKAAAWGSAVYKLCNSIECNEGTDVNDLLKKLESCLADIINECLEKVQHLLLLNCRKWAFKSNERKIAKALYTTGKASKIMELLRGNIVEEEGSGSAIVPHLV